MTEVAAGAFSAWADRARDAQVGDADAAVPCDGCTACCRSSFFVHIGPDETATLRRIPRGLLVRAPGLPAGYMVLGYDEHGHCPMLVDDTCSIYEDRPLTCRKFDCRVLSAAGLEPDGPGQDALAEQVRRWRFDVDSERDRVVRDAVRAAVAFLEAHPECFEPGRNPVNAVQRSVTVLAIFHVFLDANGHVAEPDADAVRFALRRAFRSDVSGLVVLLGPPGAGKSTVGAEFGRIGFRWREWEIVILGQWGTRDAFVANKAVALPRLHADIRAWIDDVGPIAVIESTGLSDAAFLDALEREVGCFVVRFDVSEVETAHRLASRERGRHLTEDLAGNRRVRGEYETGVLPNRRVDLVIDGDRTTAGDAAALIAAAVRARP